MIVSKLGAIFYVNAVDTCVKQMQIELQGQRVFLYEKRGGRYGRRRVGSTGLVIRQRRHLAA